jgi:hypothetical protein
MEFTFQLAILSGIEGLAHEESIDDGWREAYGCSKESTSAIQLER